jgi:2-keto-4-pentenoate hydratase/2-oxohepta-3-ene-1,7-dioic acid hydratase in catechol pathway
MKLIRHGTPGNERPGIVLNEQRYDTSRLVSDYNEQFFESGGLRRLKDYVSSKTVDLPSVPDDTRIGCPVARPSKIICTGLNYADHALEMTQELPSEPVIFLKATSALTGPYDNILIPRNSIKTDWEVELAVVIKKRCSYVEEVHAMEYVAGFMVHNDVSEREFQLERNGTWGKGKGCDTFAPMGPYLVTPDEIPDLNNLRLWLKLNGKIMQDANTSSMIFKIPCIISYISQFMTLLPGDIISTGSPSGVGKGQNPPFYLKHGDVLELGIDCLGSSRQTLKDYKS